MVHQQLPTRSELDRELKVIHNTHIHVSADVRAGAPCAVSGHVVWSRGRQLHEEDRWSAGRSTSDTSATLESHVSSSIPPTCYHSSDANKV